MEWLGPYYFNEEIPIIAGSPVRIITQQDRARFRNGSKYSALVRGTVSAAGSDFCEVSVEERFGLKVTLKHIPKRKP